MENVIDDFQERCAEVNDYMQLLRSLESNDKLLFDRTTGETSSAFNTLAFKVMKANVFLLVYNAVESAIRAGYGHVYTQMNNESLHMKSVTDKIRNVWLKQQFTRMDKAEELAPKHFKNIVAKIAELVFSERTIEMNKDHLPVSGNLNAERVRNICYLHGVQTDVSPAANRGAKLDDVWNRRNQLSHGQVLFSECGKDFSVDDLQAIVNETFAYVRDILRNIETFTHAKEYRQAP